MIHSLFATLNASKRHWEQSKNTTSGILSIPMSPVNINSPRLDHGETKHSAQMDLLNVTSRHHVPTLVIDTQRSTLDGRTLPDSVGHSAIHGRFSGLTLYTAFFGVCFIVVLEGIRGPCHRTEVCGVILILSFTHTQRSMLLSLKSLILDSRTVVSYTQLY